jgi:hypothetical protein
MKNKIKRTLQHRGFTDIDIRELKNESLYVVFQFDHEAEIPYWLEVLQITGNEIVATVEIKKLERSCDVCGGIVVDYCIKCEIEKTET